MVVDAAEEVFVDVASVVEEVAGLAVVDDVWGLPPPEAPHVNGLGPGIVYVDEEVLGGCQYCLRL